MAYPSFHVNSPMESKEVVKGTKVAKGQERVIMRFFKKHPDSRFTPPEVQEATGLKCPLTSVRRAITTLTRKGKLKKCVLKRRKGKFGLKNCTWRLRKKPKGDN